MNSSSRFDGNGDEFFSRFGEAETATADCPSLFSIPSAGFDGDHGAGDYHIPWDDSSVNAGVYSGCECFDVLHYLAKQWDASAMFFLSTIFLGGGFGCCSPVGKFGFQTGVFIFQVANVLLPLFSLVIFPGSGVEAATGTAGVISQAAITAGQKE